MNLKEQLIRDEGIRRFVYKDSHGILTIGCGRNLEHNGLSADEIDYLLFNDMAHVTSQVSIALPWSDALDDARRGVLHNLAFNMGVGKLLTFRKMLAAMQTGDWITAAKELLDSAYHQQVGKRAERLAEQMVSGEWV